MRKSITLAAGTLGLALAGTANAATVIAEGAPGTSGVTALYMTELSEISTSDGSATNPELMTYLGVPDDDHEGLGEEWITYDLGTYRFIDGPGQDFNVYEVDFGVVEFNLVDVLVSADNLTFYNVEDSFDDAIDLAGDETHSVPVWRRSYDLGAAVQSLGVSEFRYLRLQGTGSGTIGGNNDFDPDAVGFANFIDTQQGAVPEPQTWALMLAGFAFVGGAMRRRQASSSRGVVA